MATSAAISARKPGNLILIGSEDPECDPKEHVDPDEFYAGKGGHGRNNELSEEQWKAQVLPAGAPHPHPEGAQPAQGRV